MDARTRRPVPGVEVAVFAAKFEPRLPADGDACLWRARSFARHRDAWERNRARGWLQVSDDRGEFVVSGPAQGAVSVACRLAGRYAESRLLPRDAGGARDLWLEPELAQRVRILDHRGDPAAGLYIRASCEPASSSDEDGGAWLFDAWTDERGEAEIKHLQTVPLVSREPAKLQIRLGCLGMAVEHAVFDPAARSADVIEWRLPPTGSVRLTLRDQTGRAIAWPFSALVGTVNAERDPELDFAMLSERVAQGDYIFPFVRLGVELAIGGSGQFSPLIPERILGPTLPGAVKRQAVRVDVADHRISMLVTDASGQPLRGQQVRLSFRAEGKAFGYTDLTLNLAATWAKSNAQGRAEWTLRAPTTNMAEYILDAYGYQDGKLRWVRWGVHPRGRRLPIGPHDLGVIKMAHYHPYCRGKIDVGSDPSLPESLELAVHDVEGDQRGARLDWVDSVSLHWLSEQEFEVHVAPAYGHEQGIPRDRRGPLWLQFWANGRPWGQGRIVQPGDDTVLTL